MTTPSIIHAPWTVEQVLNAEAWQRCGHFHPYTCGNREGHPYEDQYGDHGVLRPTTSGWMCAYCDYTQDWAHEFTLNSAPLSDIHIDAYVPTGWSIHITPDGKRFMMPHDKNSVHMNGCIPMYVRKDEVHGA